MGNHSMRRHNQERSSRQSRSSSLPSGNRHAESLDASSRPINPHHRSDTAPRTAREHAGPRSRSRQPSTIGSTTPSSAFRRPQRGRPRQSQPRVSRRTNTSSGRRRRTRPRSRPNAQSGGPVGGDLAVPGDQSTSPQPPEETQNPTCNTPESVVRQDRCLPETSPPFALQPCSPCIPTLVSASNSCQHITPTRWKLLKKHGEKLKGSQTDIKGCPTADARTTDVPSPADFTLDVSQGALLTSPSETPAVIPPMATGFYFGASSRQSWPHTVASAEYFTVLSTRRMKKLEPSLYTDEMTTTFEVDEDDSEEQNQSGEERDDNQSANAAAAVAALAFESSSKKRPSHQKQNIRRPRCSKNTTSRKARLRRANVSKSSSTNLRGSVMHDVLRKLLSVGHRCKGPKKNANGRTNDKKTRQTVIFSPTSVKSRSSEKDTYSPRSCSLNEKSLRQEDRLQRRTPSHHLIEEDNKPSGSLSYRNGRGCPSSYPRRTPQQEQVEKIHHRKCSGALKKQSKVSSASPKNPKISSIPKQGVHARARFSTDSTQRSMSIYDAEDDTFDSTCCTDKASGTIATLSNSRNSSVTEEGHGTLKPKGGIRKEKIFGTRKTDRTSFKAKCRKDEPPRCERCDQTSALCSCDFQSFASSRLGSCGPPTAQLILNNVHKHNLEQNSRTKATIDKNEKKGPDIDYRNTSEASKGILVGMSRLYNSNGISDAAAQNVHENDFLMRRLVEASLQNAVFPHLITAQRSSKTTQITPEDLFNSQGTASVTTETLKENIYATPKCTELPVHDDAMPSTSRRKNRKMARLKNKLNIFTRVRGTAKNKYVKGTACVSDRNTPRSANKRVQALPDNANCTRRQGADTALPKTRLRARTKPIKKRPTNSPRTVSAPKSSTSLSKVHIKPYIAFIMKQQEDNSGSELVSLFRAGTGSSIQSVEMDSSTSTLRLKAANFLKRGKGIKDANFPSKPRSPAKDFGKANIQGTDTKPRCEKADCPNSANREESHEGQSYKPPSESRKHGSSPLSNSDSKKQSPRLPRDKARSRQTESPCKSALSSPKQSTDVGSKQNSPKSLSKTVPTSGTLGETGRKSYSPKPQRDAEPKKYSARTSGDSIPQSPKTPRSPLSLEHSTRQRRDSMVGRSPKSQKTFGSRSPDPPGNPGASEHFSKPGDVSNPNITRGENNENASSDLNSSLGKQVSSLASNKESYTKTRRIEPDKNGAKPETETQLHPPEMNGTNYVIFEEHASKNMNNDDITEHLKPLLIQNCFGPDRVGNATHLGNTALRNIPTSVCSCNVHEGYSLSATSMIPAVGSYEDKVLAQSSWSEQRDSGNAFHVETLLPLKHRHESVKHPKVHQISEPPLEGSKNGPVKLSSGSVNDILSPGNTSTPSLCRYSAVGFQEDVNFRKFDGRKIETDHSHKIHENVKTRTCVWLSAGVLCQSEAESDPSVNPETNRTRTELHSDISEYQKGQLRDYRPVSRTALGRIQEMSTILLQKKESGQRTGFSAASMAASAPDRQSSRDVSESCPTHSIGSKDKGVSITSLTDAVSSISSIPEDTLPNIVNSNSTHHILVDEFCCDFSTEVWKGQSIPHEPYHCRCHKNSWTSVSYHESSKKDPVLEPKRMVFENPREIELVRLKAPDEAHKRSHGRPPAAMHVSWDTSMSTALCAHSKCGRCGAHRKEGTDVCQSVGACRCDQHQDSYSHTRHSRCGRCASCHLGSCINNDIISQLSSTDSHVTCYHDYADHQTNDDSKFPNFGNIYPTDDQQNASPELQWSDTHTVVLQTTPTHPLPAPQSRVPWGVLPSTSPTLKVTSGTISTAPDAFNENVTCVGESNPLAVASFWPTMVPTPGTSADTLPGTPSGQRIKPHNPRLTLSPVYTTSLPEDVTARASRSFNKDILLQRIAADLLENHSSIPSIDSNKVGLVGRNLQTKGAHLTCHSRTCDLSIQIKGISGEVSVTSARKPSVCSHCSLIDVTAKKVAKGNPVKV